MYHKWSSGIIFRIGGYKLRTKIRGIGIKPWQKVSKPCKPLEETHIPSNHKQIIF
jgi:hypothetical protein